MKNNLMKVIIIFVSILFALPSFAQKNRTLAEKYLHKKGEVFLHFTLNLNETPSDITSKLSIINYDKNNKQIFANLNQKEFNQFVSKNKKYWVLEADNADLKSVMFNTHQTKATAISFPYNAYPTYTEYVALMDEFETQYPAICQTIEIGRSVQNRKLLAVKLSNNVTQHEKEPAFLYVATMHGDEVAGYPMMLYLIEYLVENYGIDTQVTNLLDTTEIYICPLHNPDGCYAGGNNSVNGATRRNANNVDLNRNFPDAQDGYHSDGNTQQPETIAFMQFAEANHFVLAANFHGGTEVVNYPWDTFVDLSPENDYWTYVCRDYANAVHANSSNYMQGFDNGITNGYDWYEAQGTRQGYMNYYLHSKEITIELSNQKTPPPNQLTTYWDYNRDALLNYMDQVQYGIHGDITDANTGLPIEAKIFVENKDDLNTWTESYLPYGDYYRPIKQGTYQVTYSAPCYQSQTITVSVTDGVKTIQNVGLIPLAEEPLTTDESIDSGESANLTATASGNIFWYDSATATNQLATGNNFTTPNLTVNTTYYVENQVAPTPKIIPSPNNTNNGSYFSGSRGIFFDCMQSVNLKSVEVNAETAGSFTVELRDSEGIVLQTGTFNVQAGIQTVDLNFDLPMAKDLQLIKTSGVSLYRNNANVNYPYKVEKFITIKRSDVTNNPFNYYYSFYNFEVQQATCVSERIPVTVTVNGVVSTNEFILNNVQVYPNPVKDNLTIILTEGIQLKSIYVFDLLGKKIQSLANLSNSSTLLDTQYWDTGIYFIQINTNKGTLVKKIIK